MSFVAPRYRHAPIPMRRHHDLTDELEAATPWEPVPSGGRIKRLVDLPEIGDFCWDLRRGRRMLIVRTPSREPEGMVTNWPIAIPMPGGQWEWDGNADKPTITPSLGLSHTWHGWVRDGMLVEA